jgi:hypothetical protein
MCSCSYDCLLKYGCGGMAFVFMILYSIAIHRINSKQKKGIFLDTRDKLLLSIALTESVSILVCFMLYVHCIFPFVLRMVTILEQVTILYILAELSDRNVRLMKAFWASAITTFIITAAVLIVI